MTIALAPEIEAAIQEQAKYMGICDCQECQEARVEQYRKIAALAVSHTQQAEREELDRAREVLTSVYYDRFRTAGDHDAAVAASRRAYRAAVGLSPAPDGSQEG